MKIAVVADPFYVGTGGGFDPATVYTEPRILTGTDAGFLALPEILTSLGHEVTVFAKLKPGSPKSTIRHEHGTWKPLSWWPEEGYDVSIAFCQSKCLRGAPGRKILYEPLASAASSFLSMADLQDVEIVTLTEPQREILRQEFPEANWLPPIPIPVRPEFFEPATKIPGRVLYCFSPDRGLHHLLEAWPSIQKAVPSASLHVTYGAKGQPTLSKVALIAEMQAAEVVAFPCDIWAVETQSLATAEAFAAGCRVVLSNQPCLPRIYGGAPGLIIHRESMESFPLRFGNAVIGMLQNAPGVELDHIGREWARGRFSMEVVTAKWRKLLGSS